MKYRVLEPEEMAKQVDLNTLPGKKLRMQFFTFPLVIIPCFFLVVLYMAWIAMLLLGDFSFTELWHMTLLVCLICIPVVLILSALLLLNHYFFGRIICILGRDGIAHKAGFVRWNRIKRIEYEIHFMSRHSYLHGEYCRAIIHTGARQIRIDHAPLCLLFFARKLCPALPVGLSKDCKRDLLIWAGILTLIPFVCFILYALFG